MSFKYDGWGNCTVNNLTSSNIGDLNPFRYRSYYYDQETGYYYLNSRYYDSNVGRFISGDIVLNDDSLGNNTYTYCGNNPIVRIDSNGKGWLFVLACVSFGGVVSAGFNALDNLAYGDEWYRGAIGSFVGGAISTGFFFTGNIVVGAYAGACMTSLVNEWISYSPNYYYLASDRLKVSCKEDYDESALIVIQDTIVDGTISILTGKVVDKIISINKNWFQPKQLPTILNGNYSKKFRKSTLLDSTFSFALQIVGKYLRKTQEPTVSYSSKPFVGVGGSLYGN